MKAIIQINGREVTYEDGDWFCDAASLCEELKTKCLGEYPAYEPDPGGKDLELAVAKFGAIIIKRTYDGIDPDLIY